MVHELPVLRLLATTNILFIETLFVQCYEADKLTAESYSKDGFIEYMYDMKLKPPTLLKLLIFFYFMQCFCCYHFSRSRHFLTNSWRRIFIAPTRE